MSSGLSAADEMALMKKLGALEVENKELKKGEDGKRFTERNGINFYNFSD